MTTIPTQTVLRILTDYKLYIETDMLRFCNVSVLTTRRVFREIQEIDL